MGYRPAVDYCHPDLYDNTVTGEVVETFQENGVQIDIRKKDWRYVTESITDILCLLQYIRDEATAYLREYGKDQAIGRFLSEALGQERVEEQMGVSLNAAHIPDEEVLAEEIEEMGLEEVRAYADEQLKYCQKNQERLDLIIGQKYERGGQSVGAFEPSIRSTFADRDADLLISTHVWSTDTAGHLLSRHESPIHSRKDTIVDCMKRKKFNIISPQEVQEQRS
ncbi:hypothetical protein KI372_04175 [Halobacterium salinarum]|uniref:hypothetical protein n=1 Tax=Halobacterium salinarum TaxID=2242 RepID=UPI001F32B922|nr:hypothetical protein [Halobacterium salinarum]MCF2206354.1 hypothetical protein [Halobacterium salinarum]MCF2240614.1 hypothetical protein [Halobacterium salinarum]